MNGYFIWRHSGAFSLDRGPWGGVVFWGTNPILGPALQALHRAVVLWSHGCGSSRTGLRGSE